MKFSVVVALAPGRQAEVLASLKEVNYDPAEYEVIVETGKNASSNRNAGIKKAQGEIIAFVDDDAFVDQDWLKNADAFFAKYRNIDVVGGPQLTPESDNLFGKLYGFALGSVFGGANIRNRYRKAKLNLKSDEKELNTANMLCRKKVFNQICFNPNFLFGEDLTFLNECGEKGFKIAYSPDIFIYHQRRSNLFRLAKQIFNYAGGRAKIKRVKRNKFSTFLFAIPTIFLFYLIFLPVIFRFNIYFIIPLYLYLFCNLLVSVITTLKRKQPLGIILLPLMFLTIHLSYGAGFIWQIIKKIRWKNHSSVS